LGLISAFRSPIPSKLTGGPTGERQGGNNNNTHGARSSLDDGAAVDSATKPAAIKIPGSAVHAANPATAPLVEAALPAANAEPMTAREIATAIGGGAISTVRTVLRGIVAEGRAIASTHAIKHGNSVNRYRRAAAHEARP
jgi:hypothetical protein